MPELPDWVYSGSVVGLQGGTDRVSDNNNNNNEWLSVSIPRLMPLHEQFPSDANVTAWFMPSDYSMLQHTYDRASGA